MKPHELLEQDLYRFGLTGREHTVACSSGTAALHLALEALDLPPGSLVAVPEYCMIAVPRAVVLAGHKPVFIDVGPDLNMDPELLRQVVSSTPVEAVVVVHTYGRPADVAAVHEVVGENGYQDVIEDLAETHGLHPHPDSVAGCWSFYANKLVAGEEGGAVAVNDQETADKLRSLRCLGFTPDHDYRHTPRGHNYRLAPSLAGAVGPSLALWRKNCERLRSLFEWADGRVPEAYRMPHRPWPWVYDLRLPGWKRPRLLDLVKRVNEYVRLHPEVGVVCRPGFYPNSRQDEFLGSPARLTGEAERASDEVLYLGVHPGLDVLHQRLGASLDFILKEVN